MIALTPSLIKYLALQQLKLILAECTHSCRMSASSWTFLARLLSLRRTNSNNLLPRHAALRSVLHLVCAYTVHICLLSLSLSEASHCSLPLQPWSVGNFSMQLLDPLVTLPQPNDTTHWLLVTLLTLLWLRATMGSVLSFSAHSAELSRFCLLFQLHFVVVYSALSADSCLAPPTPLCGCRFAVGALASRSRYVTTTRSAVWALCHIRYFPSRVLLTVSLCLAHAGVSTTLNSVARLLLNEVYRLVLNVSDASLSFLTGSSRASCTSEPAWRISGPCASAPKCYSARTQQHLLDLTVASTVSSDSSAPVFPLCTLHGVLITSLASL